MADPSFDIVSEVNWMEVSNALQQAQKEIASRFDFKGTAAEIRMEGKDKIILVGDSEPKLRAVRDVLDSKLTKRGVSLKGIEASEPEAAAKATLRQTLSFKNGLESDLAKDIAKFIKGLPVKVQTTIQGDQLRVSGKKKDDLQAVMGAVRAQDWPQALQFTNYR
jgi:uncharacterized protein YajQ (UPF0234 family)